MPDISISAIIAFQNDEKTLDNCFFRLGFCDEIFAVDLGSNDNSVKIAAKYNTKILSYGHIPFVEKVHSLVAPKINNKWILITDPDEELPLGCAEVVNEYLKKYPQAAQFDMPIRYYFRGRALRGTVWGYKNHRIFILNKDKVVFLPRVHQGIAYKEDVPQIIKFPDNCFIKHYWVNSYKDLFAKHRKYIELEGQSRHDAGERYYWWKKARRSIKVFLENMIFKKAHLDGFDGIFLSFFYSYYIWQCYNSLRDYENRRA